MARPETTLQTPPQSKTTTRFGIGSIITSLIASLVSLQPLTDGDPATQFSVEGLTASVTALLVGLGLIKARDNNISDYNRKMIRLKKL